MRALEAIPQAVSVAQFKRAVHIIEQDSDDDILFNDNLQAAQEVIETATNRLMSARSVEVLARVVGGCRWWFPAAPLSAVSEVAFQDAAGVWVIVPETAYRVEMPHDEPQIVFASDALTAAPDGAPLRVRASLPASDKKPLTQAVILMVKDWYEAGISEDRPEVHRPANFVDMSWGVRRLVKQAEYKRPREWAAV